MCVSVCVNVITHQFFELSLSVAELFVHAEAHLSALQRGDDLQLGIFVLNDVVLQHQTQDLDKHINTHVHTLRGQTTDFRLDNVFLLIIRSTAQPVVKFQPGSNLGYLDLNLKTTKLKEASMTN